MLEDTRAWAVRHLLCCAVNGIIVSEARKAGNRVGVIFVTPSGRFNDVEAGIR